jgi:thiol-disulfide isomerase/thioredoxin
MRKTGPLVALITLLAFGQLSAQGGYHLKIKIGGLRDSLCYLGNYYGEKQYLKDSCHADANGNIFFNGDKPLPGGMYLIVMPGKKYFEVIIDKEQHFSLETDMYDPVTGMKVKGSNDNTLFYDYLRFINARSKEIEPLKTEYEQVKDDKAKAGDVRKRMAAIDSAVFKYKNDFIAAHPGMLLTSIFKATEEVKLPDPPKKADGSTDSLALFYYYKSHYFDNINLQDDRLVYSPVFHPKLDHYLKKLTLQMPDSVIMEADKIIGRLKPGSEMFKYVVWWITNTYETSNIMGMDAVFVHMAKNYYTKEKAFWADDTQLFKIQDRAAVLEPILIGKKVKNLVLKDDKEAPRSLYDIKTKYTILYFWDPDCGHCQKITPKLKDLYTELAPKGLQVYAVCTEVEKDKWLKYIKEKELPWINVGDFELRNNFRHEFDISTTPQIFILDEFKQIIAKRIEVETAHDILKKKFEEAVIK